MPELTGGVESDPEKTGYPGDAGQVGHTTSWGDEGDTRWTGSQVQGRDLVLGTQEPLSSLSPGEMAMYDSGPGGGEYEGAKWVVVPAASRR